MEDNSFLVGDKVVYEFPSLNEYKIGVITKKSETVDGDYTYMIVYDEDESSHWVGADDLVLA